MYWIVRPDQAACVNRYISHCLTDVGKWCPTYIVAIFHGPRTFSASKYHLITCTVVSLFTSYYAGGELTRQVIFQLPSISVSITTVELAPGAYGD